MQIKSTKCNKASIVIAQTSNIDSASTGGALEPQELFIAGGYTDGTALWRTGHPFLQNLTCSNYTSEIRLPDINKELEIYFNTGTYIWLFIAALSIIAQTGYKTSCLSVGVGKWLMVHPDSTIL